MNNILVAFCLPCFNNMVNLPRELGIEVLIENANDFVWRHALKNC